MIDRFRLGGIICLMLVCTACNNTTMSSEPETVGDSVLVEVPNTDESGGMTPPEELIGTWQNVLISVGELEITPNDEELSTWTFYPNGTMEIDSQRISFTYEPGYIRTSLEDLKENAIIRLTADTLILANVVDDDMAEMVYVKK